MEEYKLQYLWSRIKPGNIFKTVCNDFVKVINPGVWNREAGPDFKNALINVNGKELEGDIEIHVDSRDWFNHGHENDSRYSNVVLHIVQNYHETSLSMPTVIFNLYTNFDLKPLKNNNYPLGDCAQLFSKLSNQCLKDFFISAGIERFEQKAKTVAESILKRGTDETLLLNIFEALGYKKNKEQFKELAFRLFKYNDLNLNGDEITSILWGESKLVPEIDLNASIDDVMNGFVYNIWQTWWKLRKNEVEPIDWVFSGVRPYNNPYRRVAAAAGLLNKFGIKSPFTVLLELFQKAGSWRSIVDFIVVNDGLWDNYLNFRSKIARKSSVLGETRALDMLANVVLPFILAYSKINEIAELENKCYEFYVNLPLGQKNIIYEMSVQRWFTSKEKANDVFTTMVAQQGVIHLYKNYCKTLKMDCSKCDVNNHQVFDQLPK